jgi:hypothetical protein
LQKEFPEENLAQKRVSRSKVCKRAFQKHILQERFAKENFAKRLMMPLLMHGLLEEKQARIVVTSAADALVLLALESCKNMRLILAGCHWRRVLFKINRRSTPPSLIQLIPPPQQ